MRTDIRPISEHDVLAEFDAMSGEQTYNQRIYFIHTMTDADIKKITRQLIAAQCAEVSISEGDAHRRTLEKIEWERCFGKLSHLHNNC